MPDRRKQVGGWFPNQQDKRDYEYGMIAGSPLLPSKVDLVTGNLKRFLHQGKAPSCVGYAIAHQLMIEESLSGIRTSTPSATYIYAMARKQHQSELQITGTFPRLAYKGIRSMGCPPDQFWENSDNPEWLKIMPNDVARRHAMGRSGLKFYRIYGADRAEQIRGALSEGHPVCMGGPIVQAMYDYSSFDVVRRPDSAEPTYGGHYTCIAGYSGSHFHVVNSWANQEIMRFHEDYIEWEKVGDFTVITGWRSMVNS